MISDRELLASSTPRMRTRTKSPDSRAYVTSAPKTATFQMRINPEVKQRMEDIYARQGLSFTDAVNIFIQQSLNMEGLPFLASPENAEYMKAKAMRRLLDEAEKGWKSAEKDGWVSEEDAYRTLGVTE